METQRQSGRIRKRWIVLTFVGIAALVVVVGHLLWTIVARKSLNEQVAAYRAAGEPIERDDFVGYGVAPGENCVPELQAAAQMIDARTPAWEAFGELQITPPFPLRPDEIAVLRELVAETGAVFPLVESASTKQGVDWQLTFQGPAIGLMLPSLNEYRHMASLLHADALLAHTDGDDARAVRRAGEVLFLSRAMGRQPILVSHLVSVGIGAMAAKLTADLAPDLRVGDAAGHASPQQLRDLIAQLLDESHLARSQHDGMLGERMFELDVIRSLADGTIATNGRKATRRTLVGYALTPTFLDDAMLVIRHSTAIREAAAASRDWPSFRRAAPVLPASIERQRWRHLAANLILPSLDRVAKTNYHALAERRAAAVALAARLYAIEHGGQVPESLDRLVPDYIPAVPLDPMSDGQPMRYDGKDPDPRMWTVGENGRDDGGRDVVPTESKRWNDENTDWVVHLRRQPRPAPPKDEPLSDGMEEDLAESPTTLPATAPPGD